MAITALPTAPSRSSDPSTFADDADTWVAALATFTTEANALQTDVNAKQVTASAAAVAAAASAVAADLSADNASDSADLAETNSLAYIGWYSARHQGSHASAPSVRNDTSALVAGDLYYNTADGNTYIWS